MMHSFCWFNFFFTYNFELRNETIPDGKSNAPQWRRSFWKSMLWASRKKLNPTGLKACQLSRSKIVEKIAQDLPLDFWKLNLILKHDLHILRKSLWRFDNSVRKHSKTGEHSCKYRRPDTAERNWTKLNQIYSTWEFNLLCRTKVIQQAWRVTAQILYSKEWISSNHELETYLCIAKFQTIVSTTWLR